MLNSLMFFGSCGHIDFTTLTDEQWEEFAAPRTIKLLGGGEVTVQANVKIGRTTRRVYVYPDRYFNCLKCSLAAVEN